jgi:hypothetical protein
MVSRHTSRNCIEPVERFPPLYEVENPLLEDVKHAEQHLIEVVALREITHDTGKMSPHVDSSMNKVRREYSIDSLGDGIAEHSILVMNPPGVLLC